MRWPLLLQCFWLGFARLHSKATAPNLRLATHLLQKCSWLRRTLLLRFEYYSALISGTLHETIHRRPSRSGSIPSHSRLVQVHKYKGAAPSHCTTA